MKNKVLIIGILSVFLLSGVVFAFIQIRKGSIDDNAGNTTLQNSDNGSSLGERDRADKYITWQDPAGFTFLYPESWLFDTHEQDVTNYANLGISKRGEVGGITILATDAKYKTILDWTKKDTTLAGASFMETTLGGVRAQKALVKTGAVVVGMIDNGVLYTIELMPDSSEYWKNEYNKVLTSFMLVYPTDFPKSKTDSQNNNSAGSSGDVIEEEEEVVE